MSFEHFGVGGLDYFPCRYGESRILFRGPRKSPRGEYCVALGGSETYGRFLEAPYADILQSISGRTVINLGCNNAGYDVFARDPEVLGLCRGAVVTILQLTGIQNFSNRFYRVHPRHNDRFLQPTDLLRTIYQDVDFTEIHFTGHLLNTLADRSMERFGMVLERLQLEWLERMKSLLSAIGGDIVLVWMADHAPCENPRDRLLWREPMFLGRDMLDQLAGHCSKLIEVVATPDEISAGHARMIYSQMEEPAAHRMLGPIVHQTVARELRDYLETRFVQ